MVTIGALMGGLWNVQHELLLVVSVDNKVPLCFYFPSYSPLSRREGSGLSDVLGSLIQKKRGEAANCDVTEILTTTANNNNNDDDDSGNNLKMNAARQIKQNC